jgi:hypothetical protein
MPQWCLMKRRLLPLLAAISCAFAGDPNIVIIDTFDNPKTKVRFISSSEVEMNGKVIPWNKLNAQVQFKLKGARQKLLAIEAADKENAEREAEIRKAAEALGIVPISGSIISVTENGCIVNAGSGMVIFLRGLRGRADGERINVKGMKTEETFRYTTVLGASKTLRIYDLAQ